MGYTFIPKERCARAFGHNMDISTKHARTICAVIRGKKLDVVQRLLSDVSSEKRSLKGKYYTKTVSRIAELLGSCVSNSRNLGLDEERLFVHASAHGGSHFQRRRRKNRFGSLLKRTHVEMMVIERGSARKRPGKQEMKKETAVKNAAANERKELQEKAGEEGGA